MPDIDVHPFLATDAVLDVKIEAAANAPWALVVAFGNQWTPIPPIDMVVLLDLASAMLLNEGTTDASGRGTFPPNITAPPGFEGTLVHLQALSFDPVTPALRCSNVSSIVTLQ